MLENRFFALLGYIAFFVIYLTNIFVDYYPEISNLEILLVLLFVFVFLSLFTKHKIVLSHYKWLIQTKLMVGAFVLLNYFMIYTVFLSLLIMPVAIAASIWFHYRVIWGAYLLICNRKATSPFANYLTRRTSSCPPKGAS